MERDNEPASGKIEPASGVRLICVVFNEVRSIETLGGFWILTLRNPVLCEAVSDV